MPLTDLAHVDDLSTISPEDLNSIADYQGKIFAFDIKTNQIRNIYSEVLSIRVLLSNKNYDAEIERKLVLLKPKLAYAAGRQRSVAKLFTLFSKAIDGVTKSKNKDEAARNFIVLVESIVAYHKFHDGKDR